MTGYELTTCLSVTPPCDNLPALPALLALPAYRFDRPMSGAPAGAV
jgi:hypothetical protein